ncbi:MAG: PaaI family thioesterase [Chloroherpetonaceae bacterium]|nr:PaaI family thioesterase [Chloroherpetonaceae bacterium]MCS7210669.1 PaaI family thioesterase [Chloroherpetonaceae bacterium]MDW8020934.1 PaaI family thioesterase [Chloroherpetonaceae bacterium]
MNAALAYLQSRIGQSFGDQHPSPVGRWLNGTIRHAEAGEFIADFVVRPDMTNPVGILHGGIVATIMDEAMGIAIYTLDDTHFFVAINLAVDFLRSAKLGEVITARAKVVRRGRRIIHAECHISNASGDLLAKGSCNCVITELSKT